MRSIAACFSLVTLLVLSLVGCCGSKPEATATPEWVKRLEGPTAPVALPDSAPGDWLLAHIDVETNGLVPGWHEMIDIGLVMTDLDGNVIDSLFVLVQPEHPERTSPGARAVNAFDAAKWKERGALAPAAAAESILAFHRRVAGDKHVLMVAYNCQFDTAFLDHLFRTAGHSWREMYYYYVLDIPSMLWGLGDRQLTADDVAKRFAVEDEPHVAAYHTGITGAMVNVRLYRMLLAHRAEILAAAKP
jgi:DNA polymerase III epsilon subunit-like protein